LRLVQVGPRRSKVGAIGVSAVQSRAFALACAVLCRLPMGLHIACTRPLRAVLAVVAATGCAALDDTEIGSASASIVGGSISEHGSVVAITTRGVPYCTGTLIAPRVVLTAGHCVPEHVPGVGLRDIAVAIGSDAHSPHAVIPVEAARAHPEFSVEVGENDVGLIVLAQDPSVAPLPLASSIRIGLIAPGLALRAIGYGRTESANPGSKRATEVIVAAVGRDDIELAPSPGITCDGDSGGPLIDSSSGIDVIVGVHSRSNCTTLAFDARVDVHLESFINPLVSEVALGTLCEADGVCVQDCVTDSDCEGGDIAGGCAAAEQKGGAPLTTILLLIAGLGLRVRSAVKLDRAGPTRQPSATQACVSPNSKVGNPVAMTEHVPAKRAHQTD